MTIGKGTHTLKEIPQSVTVMTRKQMDDQDLTDLKDAANQTTGLVGVQGVGKGMILTSRGFQIDDWQYDGVPIPRNTYALGNWATQDLIFFDRMEVLRGASGLLQGTGSPGGAINLVRKRGQNAPTVTLTGQGRLLGPLRPATGRRRPAEPDGTVRGRLVADEDQSHSFIDYEWSKTHSLYGALDFDLREDTTLGLAVSHSDGESRPMIRRPAALRRRQRHCDLPRSTYTGAAGTIPQIDVTTVYADLEHRFNDDWAFKVGAVRMTENNKAKNQRLHGRRRHQRRWQRRAIRRLRHGFRRHQASAWTPSCAAIRALAMAQEVMIGGNYSKFTSDDRYAPDLQQQQRHDLRHRP